ncbi:MAG: transcriptional regulator [Pseudonocardia sp.]|nr:transcriptional regulator [Pseudonocardia sp.]
MPEPPADTRLVPLLLDPTRLRITATLIAAGEVEFGFVRDRVGLTDSALSKQLKALTTAGLIISRREPTGAARRTWIRMTPEGREQAGAHITALREISEEEG